MGDLTTAGLVVAAARWVVWMGAIVLIGTAGAHLLIRWSSGVPAAAAVVPLFDRRLGRLGLLASTVVASGLLLVLAAQAFSWFGIDGLFAREDLLTLVTATRWGIGWQAAAIAAVFGLVVVSATVATGRGRVPAAWLAGVTAALAVPLLGHGASHGVLNWLLHAAHLAGAGLWIGSLAVLARATWVLWRDDTPSVAVLIEIMRRFSPLALTGASLVAASGVWIAVGHVTPPDALWTTEYGRTLMVKVALAIAIAGIGYRNWRRLVPAAGRGGRLQSLRRSVRLELTLALVGVLLLTAWLSGLPVPG